METAGEADDVGSLRVGASQSNSGFDRFRAAAEKLGPPQFARRQFRNQPDEFGTWLGSEAADGDRLELFRERCDVAGMGVAETRDRNPGVQIQIRSPVEIRQRRSIPVVDRQFG